MSRAYRDSFFRRYRQGARRSAQQVVPRVLELLEPRRVIDVGCGVGAWLAVFREHGVDDVWGVDGAYVDMGQLEIPSERFVIADLSEPLRIDEQFDLAVCLEVAEHLPEGCAQTLVDSLVRLAPVTLFSAAIPFQRGELHLNEQWPGYWSELFRRRAYEPVDCLRDLIWHDERIEPWYAQNLLLFASRSYLASRPELSAQIVREPAHLARVHPRLYLYMVDPQYIPVATLLRALPTAMASGLRRDPRTAAFLRSSVGRAIRRSLTGRSPS